MSVEIVTRARTLRRVTVSDMHIAARLPLRMCTAVAPLVLYLERTLRAYPDDIVRFFTSETCVVRLWCYSTGRPASIR